MKTLDAIEYDLDVIANMDTDALLRQQIYLWHLTQPRRPKQLAAAQFEADLKARVEKFITSLRSQGLNDFANKVQADLDSHFEKGVVDGS